MNKKEFERWQELYERVTERIHEIAEYWYEMGYQKFPEFVSNFGLKPRKMTDPFEDCFVKVEINKEWLSILLRGKPSEPVVYVIILPEGCSEDGILDPMIGTCVEFPLRLVYSKDWKKEIDKLIEDRIAEIEEINEEDEKNSMKMTMVPEEEYEEFEKWKIENKKEAQNV